ncbi:MAG: hypothetical protein H7318_07515 [Oligoflexus sp.]|nr:hypothetical protein [Oligoflexus sp.]
MFRKKYLIAATLGVFSLSLSCQKKAHKSAPPAIDDAAVLPLQSAADPTATPIEPPVASQPSPEPEPTQPIEPPVASQPSPEPEPTQPIEPLPPVEIPTKLKIKERQFWVYGKKDGQLAFNTPWDEEEGDAIDRDGSQVPEYAKSCLKTAEENYEKLSKLGSFQSRIQKLLASGVTADLTFLVVTVDNDQERDNLRKLDRDSYFWQWTDLHKKPVLGMNVYERGTWVWEVIASPGQCLGPESKEIRRLLDYSAKRLAEKGAKS